MSNDAPFIRPVPQRFPGTALSGTQTQLLGSLSFPAAGGVQAVDALGTVLPLSSATGSLVPAADNADDLGQITTPLRWKSGFFGTTVMTPQLTVYAAGVEALVLKLSNSGTAVNYFNATNAATGVAPVLSVTGADANINLGLAAKGAGSLLLTAPSQVNPPVATSGAQTALKVTGAINLAQTTTLEVPDVFFDLARTVTWEAGNIAEQRAVKVNAPTLVVSGSASTIATASTVSISGAPAAGAGTVISQTYSLFVETGVSQFAEGIGLSDPNNSSIIDCLSVERLVHSTVSGVAGVGAADIGGRVTIRAPNSAGTQTIAGFVTARITDVTPAAEVAELELGGAYGGVGVRALRLLPAAGDVVTRVEMTPGTTGVDPIIAGNGEADTGLILRSRGVGNVSLQGSGGVNIVSVDTSGGVSRLGFFNVGPAIKQVGVAVDIAAVHAALVAYGLIAGP